MVRLFGLLVLALPLLGHSLLGAREIPGAREIHGARHDPPTVGAGERRLLVVDLDDLGQEWLALHPQPIFNALDALGRRYDTFYTSPLCSPTRACMTYGVRGNDNDLLCTGLVQAAVDYETPTSGPLVSLPRALAARGLSSAKIGKWHLAPNDELTHPTEVGYSTFFGTLGNVGPQFGSDYYNWTLVHDGVQSQVTGLYLPSVETDAAIVALSRGYDFVSVSYNSIHHPYHTPPAHLWSGPPPVTEQDYGRIMLEALGRELGRLAAAAERHGYHLIVFSDNGGTSALLGAKGSTLEAGCNTFLWSVGPGVVPGLDPSLIAAVDIYATVLDFFGAPAKLPAEGEDSVSFWSTWTGAPGARTHVFAEKFVGNGVDPRTDPNRWDRVVRNARYKLRRAPLTFTADVLIDLTTTPIDSGILDLAALTPLEATAYQELLVALAHWERP